MFAKPWQNHAQLAPWRSRLLLLSSSLLHPFFCLFNVRNLVSTHERVLERRSHNSVLSKLFDEEIAVQHDRTCGTGVLRETAYTTIHNYPWAYCL